MYNRPMFALAFAIGIYSYVIFVLGLAGILYKPLILVITFVYWLLFCYLYRSAILSALATIRKQIKRLTIPYLLQSSKTHTLFAILILLFIVQAIVNGIGVLGPELAFDALWYHLTLPKLYLINHAVYHIPGGLLYYSDMPKLAEMLYIGGLAFGNEITVKFIHYCFGLLTCIAIYKVSRKWFTPFISFLAIVIFYSNLVVAWESITAYIDLVRTFFEVMALWAFLNWWGSLKRKWLLVSAVLLGFAITTKLLAIGSLCIFLILIVSKSFIERKSYTISSSVRDSFVFAIISLVVPLPWFIFSYIHTGNPVYPFFSHLYHVAPSPLNLLLFVKDIFVLLTHASDPVSPLYLLSVPLLIYCFKKLNPEIRLLSAYSLFALVVWYFTPRTGGGRFIVPYLPAFSIVVAGVVAALQKKDVLFRTVMVVVLCVASFTILYRGAANAKYVPVIVGGQTKAEFLSNRLDFSYGNFYDSDGYFSKHITDRDKVLLLGFHNLYYVDFPFVDSSWKSSDESFNYIAVQKALLPDEYRNWKLVYFSPKTMIELYKKP